MVGESATASSDAFKCVIRPELHHWFFDLKHFKSTESGLERVGTHENHRCTATKTIAKSRRDLKRWRSVPMGVKSVMPSGGMKLLKTFPHPRNSYWTVSVGQNVAGARCPITCDEGYRLKDPAISEFTCTSKRHIKSADEKVRVHNSFGHLLCVEDRCDLPANTNYVTVGNKGNYCDINRNSVAKTSGCAVDCAPNFRLQFEDTYTITCNNGQLNTLPKCVAVDKSKPDTSNLVAASGSVAVKFANPSENSLTLRSTLENLVLAEVNGIANVVQSETKVSSTFVDHNDGNVTVEVFFEYVTKKSNTARLLSTLSLSSLQTALGNLPPSMGTVVDVPTLTPDSPSSRTCTSQLKSFASMNNLNLSGCTLNGDGSTCTDTARCADGYDNIATEPMTVTCIGNKHLTVDNAFCVPNRCYVGTDETHNFGTFSAGCQYDKVTYTIKKTAATDTCTVTCKDGYDSHNIDEKITCGPNKKLESKAMCTPTKKKCYLGSTDNFLKPDSSCNIYQGVDATKSCKVSCIDGYALKDDTKSEFVCGSNGEFDVRPVCVKSATSPQVDSYSVVPQRISIFLFAVLVSYNVNVSAL